MESLQDILNPTGGFATQYGDLLGLFEPDAMEQMVHAESMMSSDEDEKKIVGMIDEST